ncbi:MAG: hypothetical protein QM733_19530 [Ilumatobacteraceae bacterium]
MVEDRLHRGAGAQIVGYDDDERRGRPHALVELDDRQWLRHLGGERRVRRLAAMMKL